MRFPILGTLLVVCYDKDNRASRSFGERSRSVILYLAVNSYYIKALIYGPFYRKWNHLPLASALDFQGYISLSDGKCWQSPWSRTSDLSSVGLPIIKPWHFFTGQRIPTWSSGNSTDFTQWPQHSLFAQGVHSNTHSQRCVTAQSTPVYFIHVCSKSVSETFGSPSRYIKLLPVDERIKDLHSQLLQSTLMITGINQ